MIPNFNPTNLVCGVIQEVNPSSLVLPGALLKCFDALHYIRCSWRCLKFYNKIKIAAEDTDNIIKLVAEQGISCLIEERRVVQFCAQVIYVLKCLNAGLDEYNRLYRARNKLLGIVRGYFPIVNEGRRPFQRAIPVSRFDSLVDSLKRQLIYMQVLALKIYKVVKSLFKLSMISMDIVDAFSKDASKRIEIVHEVFDERAVVIDELISNGELFIEKLKKNEAMIQRILTYVNIKGTAQGLISQVESSFNKVQKANKYYQDFESSYGDFLINSMKEVAFGVFSSLGFVDYMPSALIPPISPPTSEPPYSRYALDEGFKDHREI